MICIRGEIPKFLNQIDDEQKAIYHSIDSFCVFVFVSQKDRDQFVKESQGMDKAQRQLLYSQYNVDFNQLQVEGVMT